MGDSSTKTAGSYFRRVAVSDLGQWDKLVAEILMLDKSLRFEELAKALCRIGYIQSQPKGGGSHYTFRKTGKLPITIPRAKSVNKAYIEIVRDAVLDYEQDRNKEKE
jgi:predicted RNA binding protein YcfA (HicA-like mRNA interferase family)